MSRQGRAYVFAVAAVLLWSTMATAFKLTLRGLDALQLLLYANLVSVVTLLAVLAWQGRLHLLTRTTAAEFRRSLALGVLNPFLYYVILFKAYELLPAQQAQPLNYTWAITLTVLSVPLLGQRIGARDFAAIAVSYLGVLVISTRGDLLALRFDSGPGVALALGSTVIWALYWIYNTRESRDPVLALALNFLLALPFVAATTALFSQLWPGWTAALAGAAYVGLFEMGVTFVLWLTALRLSETTAKVGNLIFFSPFLSLVFIHFLVGEAILPATVVGLGFIVAGNAIQRLRRRRRA